MGGRTGCRSCPPTADRVAQFIERGGRSADDVVGELPERRRRITVEKVAANAVMAGCLPEYMPVVLAASEAMLDPKFNLVGPSSSLGGSGILAVVNGPIARELSINARNNLFGPGNRANATIGRAMRLILMNACAAVPGTVRPQHTWGIRASLATASQRPKPRRTGCRCMPSAAFARSRVPLRCSPAKRPAKFAQAAARKRCLPQSRMWRPRWGLRYLPSALRMTNRAVVRQGELGVVISGESRVWDGWSKRDVRQALQPMIRRTLADIKRAGEVGGDIAPEDETRYLPLVADPDDVLLVFAGGEERTMCAVIPSWGPKVSSTAVTKAVRSA